MQIWAADVMNGRRGSGAEVERPGLQVFHDVVAEGDLLDGAGASRFAGDERDRTVAAAAIADRITVVILKLHQGVIKAVGLHGAGCVAVANVVVRDRP